MNIPEPSSGTESQNKKTRRMNQNTNRAWSKYWMQLRRGLSLLDVESIGFILTKPMLISFYTNIIGNIYA